MAPTGDSTLELTCLDIHETDDTRDLATGPYRKDAYPVWTSRLTLPAATDMRQGLPFRFDLPTSVGPKPVQKLEPKNAYVRFSASVNIPGLRRIVTRNAPPVGRTWALVASAPARRPRAGASGRNSPSRWKSETLRRAPWLM